jgi:3-phenylpropionate/trans-cinnamate dioxygenase ferredoxin component
MESQVRAQNFSFKDLFIPGKKFRKAAEIDDLEVNQMKLVRVKGKNILLCRSMEGYYAVSDTCAHKTSSLSSKGIMINNTLQCLKHGCRYDLKSGKLKSGPGKRDIQIYNVSVREDGIYIEC